MLTQEASSDESNYPFTAPATGGPAKMLSIVSMTKNNPINAFCS
ncbi:hypothetical protein [Spirosoma jeollabukense]